MSQQAAPRPRGTMLEDQPEERRRIPWRTVRNWTLVALALGAFGTILGIAIASRESPDHKDKRRVQQCLDNHGIVRTDGEGWFDGCLYGNLTNDDLTGNG